MVALRKRDRQPTLVYLSYAVVLEAFTPPLPTKAAKKSAVAPTLTWVMSDCAFSRQLYSSFTGNIAQARDTTSIAC
jgi:hypothetical protein